MYPLILTHINLKYVLHLLSTNYKIYKPNDIKDIYAIWRIQTRYHQC